MEFIEARRHQHSQLRQGTEERRRYFRHNQLLCLLRILGVYFLQAHREHGHALIEL